MGTRGATNSSPISARTFLETSSISFLAYFLVLPKSLISIRYSGVRKQLPFSENNFYLLSFFPLRLDDSKAFKALVVVVANPTILDSSENLILSCFLKAWRIFIVPLREALLSNLWVSLRSGSRCQSRNPIIKESLIAESRLPGPFRD